MNKLIAVTGGTKGIGKSIILKFMDAGFDVVTCARNSQDLDSLQAEVNDLYPDINITTQKADLRSKEETEKFIQRVQSLGPVEVLVNNTGSFLPGSILGEEDGVFENMIETNLYSAYRVTRGIAPSMVEQKKGHIFMMCSTASFVPYPNGGSYCIAKYGMLGMTRVLREELKGEGIKVTAIMPGATFTASWEGADIPEERFMKAEDVADSIYSVYALSSRTVVEEVILRPQLGDL